VQQSKPKSSTQQLHITNHLSEHRRTLSSLRHTKLSSNPRFLATCVHTINTNLNKPHQTTPSRASPFPTIHISRLLSYPPNFQSPPHPSAPHAPTLPRILVNLISGPAQPPNPDFLSSYPSSSGPTLLSPRSVSSPHPRDPRNVNLHRRRASDGVGCTARVFVFTLAGDYGSALR
jgi:hypothetical protein